MASTPWFYHAFDQLDAANLTLEGAEVQHILGARRLNVEDQIVLMNGRGKLAECTIQEANKKAKSINLRVDGIQTFPAPQKSITLACAIPKGDRLSTMLDMACQLGMTHFQPLVFNFSVAKWNDKAHKRAERILLEAAKQSKRAWLPEIIVPESFAEFAMQPTEGTNLRLLADQYGKALQSYAAPLQSASNVTLIIGPEGGLAPREMNLIKDKRIDLVKLAEPILRIETAAIAGLSALNQLAFT